MDKNAKWIWLSKDLYPKFQKSHCTIFSDKSESKYCIGEFMREYSFKKEISEIKFSASGDAKFMLWLNDKYLGGGPVFSGGDFGFSEEMPFRYFSTFNAENINSRSIKIYARVQHTPLVMCENSNEKSGFILSGEITFSDGSKETVATDSSWLARVDSAYISENERAFSLAPQPWENAEEAEISVPLRPSPLPLLTEEYVSPIDFTEIEIPSFSKKTVTLEFDKIYSGFVTLETECQSSFEINLSVFETNECNYREKILSPSSLSYRMMRMNSIGKIIIELENKSGYPLILKKAGLIFIHYPIKSEGSFICSDADLNKIYEVGKWTLKICRQDLELDSPMHQENLGCAGDYFIESLINYFTFGDTLLTRLDIVRIAESLKLRKGFMFHTTYSLIWVQMLYDYYMFSGDKDIFSEVKNALVILFDKFKEYMGESGLIENPPSFMFVDWIYVDGFSLHHPPKALGQTVLNAFYYKALSLAAEIFDVLEDERSTEYKNEANRIYHAFNERLYERKKGLYFDGLNSRSPSSSDFLPENTDKRYFSMHSNTLAVLYGLCPESEQKRIMLEVLDNKELITVQPYFMHFVLEAVYKTGLFEKYGIQLLKRWKPVVDSCGKGMCEGWINMPGYKYDNSHAWGCTPTYQLPQKLLGFKMLEPGFKKISLKPQNYGLEYVKITMPTPYGYIICEIKNGEKLLTVPDEIEVV